MAIAIDFGTSNTVISRWNPATQESEIVAIGGLSQKLGNNPPLIPSLVYVEDASQDKVIVGQQVRDRGLDLSNNPRFFRSFKRGIGAQIQGFLPELDGQNLTFDKVGEYFLQNILAQLEQEEKLESLVLTVPVDSFEAYRHWLGKVCASCNIEQVRMLDEPTAAALGYGTTDGELLLVVDFGGGTIDLSLVRLDWGSGNSRKPQGFLLKFGDRLLGETSKQKAKVARVVAKAGDNLGGTDIDNWLVDYFGKTQGLVKSSLTTRLAERLKIQLSSQTEASEVYFDDQNFESYELELDRDRFAAILEEHQFLAQLDALMSQVLQQGRGQGIEASDIDAVLLVGGTAQIPVVQTWVQKYFDASKIKCKDPFTAIARGALQLAKGYELKDYLYHSYGIRYWNRRDNCHSWHPLIKTGQPYPMDNPVELRLGASLDKQPSIELIIGELGVETGATEVYFDGDRLVTRTLSTGEVTVKPLNDSDGARTIAQLTPPGYPGSDRIKLLFAVDQKRFLRITVEDLLTGETLVEDKMVAQLS